MPEVKSPRRGSLQYYPRKRARRIYPSVSTFPFVEKAKVLMFSGYKVGMTHVMLMDGIKGSPSFGQEIAVPVTILECPPIKVLGMRLYTSTTKGLRVLNEIWTKSLPKDLERKVKIVPKEKQFDFEKELKNISDARLIVSTQPRLSGVGKKKPELFEIGIGGKSAKEKIDFAKPLLGKDISAKDVVKEGEIVDIIAVSKGKGTQGVVKRFGVKIQNRHAKKKLRHIGSLGPENPPRIRWTVPMAGQMGFQTRTEFNKRILKIGEKGEEVNPKGGIKRYGNVKGNYILIDGSVPGAKKRLVMLRTAIRPSKMKFYAPEIKEVVR